MRMTITVSSGGGCHGTGDAGGINSHTFAKDGETLYLVRHPTCVFHSSVQMARPLKTCSRIHLTSRSLLIIPVMMASLQKMKRGYCLLEQRRRVRHLCLVFPVQNLQKLVMAIDEEFPILEYLIVDTSGKDIAVLRLPETLQTPRLRHFVLRGFACPVRSRLHRTSSACKAECSTEEES
jgi:hypothetical protein